MGSRVWGSARIRGAGEGRAAGGGEGGHGEDGAQGKGFQAWGAGDRTRSAGRERGARFAVRGWDEGCSGSRCRAWGCQEREKGCGEGGTPRPGGAERGSANGTGGGGGGGVGGGGGGRGVPCGGDGERSPGRDGHRDPFSPHTPSPLPAPRSALPPIPGTSGRSRSAAIAHRKRRPPPPHVPPRVPHSPCPPLPSPRSRLRVPPAPPRGAPGHREWAGGAPCWGKSEMRGGARPSRGTGTVPTEPEPPWAAGTGGTGTAPRAPNPP